MECCMKNIRFIIILCIYFATSVNNASSCASISSVAGTSSQANTCDESFRLPKLSDIEMKAGLHTEFYKVSTEDLRWLHNEGNTTDNNEKLKQIFLNSIFRFYTKYLAGYNMNKSPEEQEKLWATLYLSALSKLFNDLKIKDPIRDLLGKFITSDRKTSLLNNFDNNVLICLEQNNLLLDLAVAYLRQKIVVEKLQNLLGKTSSEENATRLYKHDRFATDLQTMIFNFMEEVFGYYFFTFLPTLNIWTDLYQVDICDCLKTFKPSFLDCLYYKKIMDQLDELKKPMPI